MIYVCIVEAVEIHCVNIVAVPLEIVTGCVPWLLPIHQVVHATQTMTSLSLLQVNTRASAETQNTRISCFQPAMCMHSIADACVLNIRMCYRNLSFHLFMLVEFDILSSFFVNAGQRYLLDGSQSRYGCVHLP